MFISACFFLVGLAAAFPPLRSSKRGTMSGVATFNSYRTQGSTVCGPLSGANGAYGAAASDISPDISGGQCSGTIDMSKCAGQGTVAGYQGPSCPKGNCGKCYKVTNQGGFGGATIGGTGNSITVQIIDSCPSTHAENFCKTDVPSQERCEDHGTNALDIDETAYAALTGTIFGAGNTPNLEISIEDACCPGDTGCSANTGGGQSTPAAPSPVATNASPVATDASPVATNPSPPAAEPSDECDDL